MSAGEKQAKLNKKHTFSRLYIDYGVNYFSVFGSRSLVCSKLKTDQVCYSEPELLISLLIWLSPFPLMSPLFICHSVLCHCLADADAT